MTVKLTLSISNAVIVKAKRVAKKRSTSVSKMVEQFLATTSLELEENSIVDTILKNAPTKKTQVEKEKEILQHKLKAKYAH